MVPILFMPLFFEVPAVLFAGLWDESGNEPADMGPPGYSVAGERSGPIRDSKRERNSRVILLVHRQETMRYLLDLFHAVGAAALQPVIRQRMLDAMRMRKIAQLIGFPIMRYIDVNDSEEVCARST